jgi:cytochrome c peroxidase
MRQGGILVRVAALVAPVVAAVLLAGAGPDAAGLLAQGRNPYPVHLARPAARPLSAMAVIGRAMFTDARLSASGQQSCASCHDPARHFEPPGAAAVMPGGADMRAEGVRPPPSLAYLERQTVFSVGPDGDEDDATSLAQMVANARGVQRRAKTAANPGGASANLVPQGGLFWDGRADTLQQQALGPLLNPAEMANANQAAVAAKLRQAGYADALARIVGASVRGDDRLLVGEAMFALARYQIEDIAFHSYTSKFDAWLEGRARFTPAEMRGYQAFNDPERGNCGGCHVDQPGADGLPPRLTDTQFEALGAPRNAALAPNRDPAHFDLGLCGPQRTDMADQHQYCAMFITPTLRNVATRGVFFHNGVFHGLQAVLDFYNFRDVDPGRVYPRRADGTEAKFDDIPPEYRVNVDVQDAPFDRHLGETPAMTVQEEADIIAFLATLTDGYEGR